MLGTVGICGLKCSLRGGRRIGGEDKFVGRVFYTL